MEYLLGIVYGGLAVFMVGILVIPPTQREELNRFCLAKNIKLEDCVIPRRF